MQLFYTAIVFFFLLHLKVYAQAVFFLHSQNQNWKIMFAAANIHKEE